MRGTRFLSGRHCPWLAAIATVAGILSAAPVFGAASLSRQIIPFDTNWHFLKGDPAGAQRSGFDDHAWQTLDVPHDWSIAGPFDAANPTGGAGGFLPAGIGWYRKPFTLPAADSERRVYVELDGVMANSDVWINGVSLGHRPSGYVGQRYDLTGHLNFGPGKSNLLAVRADNSLQPASRWYAGAGIYRHVRLVVVNPLHLTSDATFITTITTPQAGAEKAIVRVQTTVANDSDKPGGAFVQVHLLAPNGRAIAAVTMPAQKITPGKSADFAQEIAVPHPERWDISHPALYRAVVRVFGTGRVVNDEETKYFGIREARFEAATGFWLNGKNIKIKGVCLHQDIAGFGVAVPARLWQQRLSALKSLGVNAVRTAHCPPSPEFLDQCDRLGLLVMDEMFDAWTAGKEPYDYHLYFKEWALADLRDTVRRDRNHPSIILYSAGNEIRDTPRAEQAKAILSSLVAEFHKYDPTRPVTQALFRPNSSHDYEDGLADLLDVVGQNYRENELAAAHAAKPTRKIIGTETTHDRRSWIACRDNPAFAGQFLWTGIDYLGEARRWPIVGAGSGLLDRTGHARPLAAQRQSWWSNQPMLSIARRTSRSVRAPTDPGYEAVSQDLLSRPQTLFADWSPIDREPHDEIVEVYSNCPTVTLYLNDKPVGQPQALPADGSPRVWTVPFAPGILRAEGTAAAGSDGKAALQARAELKTAGPPAHITLDADDTVVEPGFENVTQVRARIVDAAGTTVPNASNILSFVITGPARVAAVDNGDNASHEPFHALQRQTYHGTCVAYLVSAPGRGAVTLTATAPGLAPGTLTFRVGKTPTTSTPAKK